MPRSFERQVIQPRSKDVASNKQAPELTAQSEALRDFGLGAQVLADLGCHKVRLMSNTDRRIAGIGYTRAGEKLAQAGGNQRKCIVTGGLGTIAVSHKGKTYYVCCQGCVQAFNDAPEAIIADYQASLKKK